MSTHIVSDVEYIANQILLMRDGRIVLAGEAQELIDSMEEGVWSLYAQKNEVSRLMKKYKVSNLKTGHDGVELRIIAGKKPAQDAVLCDANLEDVFLYYFGEKAGEENAEI